MKKYLEPVGIVLLAIVIFVCLPLFGTVIAAMLLSEYFRERRRRG